MEKEKLIGEREYKWKYEVVHPKSECYDCGADYSSFPDVVLENDLWEKINPCNDRSSGLLCPNCIMIRLATIHEEEIKIKVFWGEERIFQDISKLKKQMEKLTLVWCFKYPNAGNCSV